ncbi:MAG: hypothetical protein IJR43_03905 [Synergistaceae bacterium]|nr:hypothetical protein [Synergistaceae bacterium]MBR0249990.1 hypothetical protein [Synergistaceae bacterium]
MSEFTSGKWKADAKTIRTSCRVFRTVRVNDIDRLSVAIIPVIHGMPEEEALANVRLIAAAPDMYRLLQEFIKMDEQRKWAASEKNVPAYMMALVAQDGAVNMSKELLARIDDEEAHS